MKYLVFVMAFLLVGCASIPKQNYLDLSPAIANTNNAVKELDVALKQKTVALKNQSIKVAQNDINRIRQQLLTEANLAKKLQEQCDFFINSNKEKDKEISSLKQRISHFNKLLFILSSIIGMLVTFMIGRIAMAFSPYGIFIGIGAGVSAFGATWALLSHL